jgi:hypothetical protein
MIRKLLLAAIVGGYALASAALPALANNDPKSPGDDCSGNPVAIGQPPDPFGATNATDIVDIVRGVSNPVDGPASSNNPGESEGAQGQANFNGGSGCS